MDKLQEKMEHLEDPSTAGVEGSTIRREYISIKQSEKECEAAANDLRNAFTKTGSTAETEKLNTGLISLQTKIARFKQRMSHRTAVKRWFYSNQLQIIEPCLQSIIVEQSSQSGKGRIGTKEIGTKISGESRRP